MTTEQKIIELNRLADDCAGLAANETSLLARRRWEVMTNVLRNDAVKLAARETIAEMNGILDERVSQ